MPLSPLFSVITVTFNAASTIGATLLSVERQTYPEVEHIIVDGLSTDSTMALVRAYAQRSAGAGSHSVRWLSERDDGLYYAMNKGLRLAQGKYLVFLNAGDTLHSPSTLASIARLQEGRDYSVLYGETDIVDAAGSFLRHRRLRAPSALTSRSFRQGMLVCHQSLYALTSLARSVPYDTRIRFSADYDWAIRLLTEGERRGLPTLNTRLVLTDYLSEGLTTRNHRRSLLERFRLMSRHYGTAVALAEHLWFAVRAILQR
ncbi:MAG: glycosyltransferase [Prevotellaceae bacterium]|nr:glycosyltransferase [Prevotellaceae bacterium]